MATPDFLLLCRGDIPVGTAFPRIEPDGRLSLHVTMDASEFWLTPDETKIEEGRLTLAFDVKPKTFGADEPADGPELDDDGQPREDH